MDNNLSILISFCIGSIVGYIICYYHKKKDRRTTVEKEQYNAEVAKLAREADALNQGF